MNTKRYEPNPIDTSQARLPSDIKRLAELLAKNAHQIWAKARMADGWRYGPNRSDSRKEHPCLVPYEQLPESEKEYDRMTAMETLGAIVALGYEIRKIRPPGD